MGMRLKYVAAGFEEDSKMLLEDFFLMKSEDFPAFASVWKKHNFVCIYMGRDEGELVEFTNEIYQLTLQRFEDPDVLNRIGVIYLLYSLYRNQIMKPPVQIRLTKSNFEIMELMLKYAIENKCDTLHYILNYLFDNCFVYTAFPSLFGPKTYRRPEKMGTERKIQMQLVEVKSEMTAFYNSNLLQDIRNMRTDYARATNDILDQSNPMYRNEKELAEEYDNLLMSLEDLLVGERKRKHGNLESTIGSKRSELKRAAYKMQATNSRYQSIIRKEDEQNNNDKDTEQPSNQSEIPKQRKYRNKRVRKEERRVGRPKKIIKKETSSEDEAPVPSLKKTERKKRGPVKRMSYLNKYEPKF